MPRLSLWRQDKSNDYNFFDANIREQFDIGGTAFLVHKYLGPENVGEQNDSSQPNHHASMDGASEVTIQDMLLMENRDRKYDPNIYELRGIYNVSDNDFDLSQFGFFLTADNLFVSFHINDMISKLGRKLMSGDVLELPHLRDDTLLDEDNNGINKFYVVEDANRSSEGFSQTWYPHVWRVKVGPMTDTQEFQDIMENDTDVLSTYKAEIEVSEAIEKAATEEYDGTLKTSHLFDYDTVTLSRGTQFPASPTEGAFFLRTDFTPHRMYKRVGTRWEFTTDTNPNDDSWESKVFTQRRFTNNTDTVTVPGTDVKSKQGLSSTITPKVDD
tara:strand:- start:4809 stop:5792 length:984 start_codon:yes stop_codon:yes gene_type:complete